MFGLSRRLTSFANIFATPLGYQIVCWPMLMIGKIYDLARDEAVPYTREITWGWHFSFTRLDPDETSMAFIFRWYLQLGPVEIRKWVNKPLLQK